jgi:hypothetical protein
MHQRVDYWADTPRRESETAEACAIRDTAQQGQRNWSTSLANTAGALDPGR